MPAKSCNPIAISKKMVTYLRGRLGSGLPVYREIVMWDDGTFQVKVVHTYDGYKKKMRVCLMYTSSTDTYVLIEGKLDDYAAEVWHGTTVKGVLNEAVRGIACSKKVP